MTELEDRMQKAGDTLKDLENVLDVYEEKYTALFPVPLSEMNTTDKLRIANALIKIEKDARTSPADSDS